MKCKSGVSDMNLEECLTEISTTSDSALSFFIGAGLSVASGLPDWNGLIKPLADKLNIKPNDLPYPRILQYSLCERAEYSRFINELEKSIDTCKPADTQRLIARLSLPRIWTTNYDGLIEQAYDDETIPYQVVAKDEDVFNIDYRRNQIIKMHGSLTKDNKTDIVLTESEYENYYRKRKAIYHLFQNDVRTKSFIYLGFSFDDSNLRNIISAVWDSHAIGKVSYLFTVPPSSRERSKRSKYNCWKHDLQRYMINVVELKDYSEIRSFLYKLLEKRYGKTVVLIGKRSDSTYDKLAERIGYKLAENGFKIHSGGGPNVANAVASGAWNFFESNKISFEDKVVFYYRYGGGSTNPQKGQILYCGKDRSEVRHRMISSDKICLLIGEEPDTENGIAEEIKIANIKGSRIIPIGCTGETARKQWELEKKNYEGSGPFTEKKAVFDVLISPTATEEQIAEAVTELADYLLVKHYE